MADPKMTLLLKRLHEKTLQSKVQWEQSVDEGAFQTSFKDYSIRLSRQPTRHPGSGDPDEEVDDTKFQKEDFGGVYPFKFMSDIHAMARRSAMGVDKAVDILLGQLDEG